MKRLVDNASPTSLEKRAMFHKLFQDNAAYMSIIRPGAGMDAGVKYTRKMMLDACS